MGETFWNADKVKVEWEETAVDWERIFREPARPSFSNKLSFIDSQIKEYIFQNSQYPVSDTGSQYLDPAWRQNIGKIHFEPIKKIQILISLN